MDFRRQQREHAIRLPSNVTPQPSCWASTPHPACWASTPQPACWVSMPQPARQVGCRLGGTPGVCLLLCLFPVSALRLLCFRCPCLFLVGFITFSLPVLASRLPATVLAVYYRYLVLLVILVVVAAVYISCCHALTIESCLFSMLVGA